MPPGLVAAQHHVQPPEHHLARPPATLQQPHRPLYAPTSAPGTSFATRVTTLTAPAQQIASHLRRSCLHTTPGAHPQVVDSFAARAHLCVGVVGAEAREEVSGLLSRKTRWRTKKTHLRERTVGTYLGEVVEGGYG
jgi:hypothetical protein